MKAVIFLKRLWLNFMLLLLPLQAIAATSCGKQLSSAIYQGVPARSNGNSQGKASSCGGLGTYGLQYQCVEYVRRFYAEAPNINTKLWPGMNAIDFFGKATTIDLIAHLNGRSKMPPVPNDILVFDRTLTSPYGHVAIIMDVDATKNTINIIEQNWSRTGIASLGMVLRDGNYTINRRGKREILGWLSRPNPPNTTPNVTINTPLYICFNANSVSLRIDVDFFDADGLDSAWYKVGIGRTWMPIFSGILTNAYITDFIITGYSQGSNKIYFKVVDKLGNIYEPTDTDTLTILVDTIPPTNSLQLR